MTARAEDGAEGWTKGPWKIRTNSQGYPYQIEAPSGDTGPGGITSVTRWASIGLPSSAEGQANACLIAAAPALYEALAGLLQHLGPNGYLPSAGEPATQRARAALLLARGGAK